MNEKINNNYNERTNYNFEKNNNRVKILLILVIVIVLLVGILSVYKMFVYDKKNNGDNLLFVEEKIKSEIINQNKYQYSVLIENNLTYDELYELYVLKEVFGSFDNCRSADFDMIGDVSTGCESNDDLCLARNVAKAYGFSDDDISKMHFDLWGYIGGRCYTFFRGSTIRNKAKEMFNYNLSQSDTKLFKLSKLGGILPSSTISVYEKDLDIYFVNDGGGGGTGMSIYNRIILNTNLKDNIYKVTYTETFYHWLPGSDYVSYINKDGKSIDLSCTENILGDNGCDYEKLYMLFNEHDLSDAENLSQYEISFKIVGDLYEFVDIKEVN